MSRPPKSPRSSRAAGHIEPRLSLDSIVQRADERTPGTLADDTVPTGFGSLDKVLGGGLRRGDLIVLGGDVGAGKSALALGVGLRVARQGFAVAFASGEMDEERLMERALAIEGRVTVDDLRGAPLGDAQRHAESERGLAGADIAAQYDQVAAAQTAAQHLVHGREAGGDGVA
ncbi:MAG: DnaB-like helicase C-terminal domain-containing protein, partial [Gemmatimonadales bacterium]